MPRSMTGYARCEASHPWGGLAWELRSVNHRYLEPGFRLPEALRSLEPQLRPLLRRYLQRGKLEANLTLQLDGTGEGELDIDRDRVGQLVRALEKVNAELGRNAAPVNALELLQWPGALREPERDRRAMEAAAVSLFEQTLSQLVAHREREGAELAQFIGRRLDGVADQVVSLRRALPELLAAQRERLEQRLAALQVELDPERLEQEVALLVQKADVDEELDRLDTHVAEIRRCLEQDSVLGRRLDFLMQELNREANTLSSKAVVADTTQAAVELKVLIEQMREQIQNLE